MVFSRFLAAGLAVAASLAASHATAAPVFATQVVSANSTGLTKDGSSIDPARLIGNNALGASDGVFYSLGFGGSITLGFGPGILIGEGAVQVFETTNGTYPLETAQVSVLDGINWVTIGSVDNAGNDTLTISGVCLNGCSRLRITDTSNAALHNAAADGFDVNAVSVTPLAGQVPAPGTAALLGLGLLGAAAGTQRRRAIA